MSLFSVDIETLALDGLDISPSEGRRLARRVEAALARLFDQRGIPLHVRSCEGNEASGKQVPKQDLCCAHCGQPERLAEELALALYQALDRMG